MARFIREKLEEAKAKKEMVEELIDHDKNTIDSNEDLEDDIWGQPSQPQTYFNI